MDINNNTIKNDFIRTHSNKRPLIRNIPLCFLCRRLIND